MAWTIELLPQCASAQLPQSLAQKLESIQHVFFDFDGVLTDNKVYTDQFGNESVSCDRADGLGIKQLKQLGKQVYILSTEANPVVQMRAKKLGVPCVHACSDKAKYMREWMREQKVESTEVAFVGNDINDLGVIGVVGMSFCPSDSDCSVIEKADLVLSRKGGDKIVRELSTLLSAASKKSQGEQS